MNGNIYMLVDKICDIHSFCMDRYHSWIGSGFRTGFLLVFHATADRDTLLATTASVGLSNVFSTVTITRFSISKMRPDVDSPFLLHSSTTVSCDSSWLKRS